MIPPERRALEAQELIMENAVVHAAPALRRPSEEDCARRLGAPGHALTRYLGAVCATSERPVVVLFDEADVLDGAAMVSFLTQLRALPRRARA